MSIAATIVEICQSVFEDSTVSLDSTTRTVENWDSLAHMKLIADIEQRFAIELDIMEMAEVESVRDVVAVVERATAGNAADR